MKKREPISTIMTKDVSTIDVNSTLHEVNEIFAKNHFRHLPVLANNQLVGIISQTDILRISFGNTFGEEQGEADQAIFDMLSINQVMKHDPVIIGHDQTIREAAQIFTEHEFHALPVLADGITVGIVTTTDIIKYFLNQ
ncbi:CBS domain-containing protein [Reichenbachiella sp.]|uniref:CBS domain-containing protein n=1 Tax=Reichenbachiella sp. TaxID=2184521 RepID=UPI003BAFCB8F